MNDELAAGARSRRCYSNIKESLLKILLNLSSDENPQFVNPGDR